jgi:hypothetical protein
MPSGKSKDVGSGSLNAVKFIMIIFRMAETKDFPKILELQKKNLLKNLEPQDQQDGFLSIEYNADQLARLNQDLGIFVAVEDDHLSGYLIAQTMDFAMKSALISTMVKRFPDVQYNARPLSGLKTFIYGPVCINKESRGQGILEGLYSVMLKALQKYDAGVAFVSEKNPRSLYAHRDKLGMKPVDEFEFNGQLYNTLLFSVGTSGAESK